MRSTFSSSRLVRLLETWAPVDTDAPGGDFAERLSRWVNAFDAIGLQSAQQAIQAIQAAAVGRPADREPTRLQALQEDFRRVRAGLAQAIAQEVEASNGLPRHLELQRQMEQAIAPLRDRARQALAKVSPALRKLAALDAVFEHLLAAREQALLLTVASLAERRSQQLRAQRSESGSGNGGDASPDFGREWRQALLAELDVRMEPVAGLIEALGNEFRNRA